MAVNVLRAADKVEKQFFSLYEDENFPNSGTDIHYIHYFFYFVFLPDMKTSISSSSSWLSGVTLLEKFRFNVVNLVMFIRLRTFF